MNRLQHLDDLSRRLAMAGAADDWDQAAAVDREAADALARWREPPRWSLAERVALAEWRDIHGDVRAQCADEARRHQSQLAALRTHRDGWMAYGMQPPADAIGSTDGKPGEPAPAAALPHGGGAAPEAMSFDGPASTKADEETP